MTELLQGKRQRGAKGSPEAGFTLVEALVAIVVLVFGLIAVINLFVIAGTTNQAANHATATVTQATETMEALKAITFTDLANSAGGDLDNDAGTQTPCTPDCTDPQLCPSQCVVPGNYNYYRNLPGAGLVRTRWTIVVPEGPAGTNMFITVRSETTAPIVGGARTRAEFTTFRTCTAQGCPFYPF